MKCFAGGIVMLLLAVLSANTVLKAEDSPTASPSHFTFELLDGLRVVGLPLNDQVEVETDFAKVKLKWSLIQSIRWRAGQSSVDIGLQNGDKLSGRLSANSFGVKALFGTVTIPMIKMRQLSVGESRSLAGLEFDGKQNYAEIPNDAAFYPSNLTVECWVKTADIPQDGMDHRLLGNWIETSGFVFLIGDTGKRNGIPVFTVMLDSGQVVARASTDIADGQWHHLAASFDGQMLRIFVDGGLECSTRKNGVPLLGREPFRLGKAAWRNTACNLAEVRISKVSRYTTNFTPAKFFSADADAVAHYRLNEGSGTKVMDETANHFDGECMGNPLPVWSKRDR